MLHPCTRPLHRKVEPELGVGAELNYGSDHPAIAPALNNLAHIRCAAGEYVEAERLYRDVYSDHFPVTTCINVVADAD